MDKDLEMLHKLIESADKEIAKQNTITEILEDQFNNQLSIFTHDVLLQHD